MDVRVVDFPEAGYTTSTDEEFVQSVSGATRGSTIYWGVALFGEARMVNRLTKHLALWK